MTAIVAFAFIIGFVLAYLIGREDGAEAEINLWASDDKSPRMLHVSEYSRYAPDDKALGDN